MLPPDVDAQRVVVPLPAAGAHAAAEVGPLVVEVQQARRAQQGGQAALQQVAVLPQQRVQQLAVRLRKPGDGVGLIRIVVLQANVQQRMMGRKFFQLKDGGGEDE